MKLQEHGLFLTSAYTTYLPDIDNVAFSEHIFNLEKASSGRQASNSGGFQSSLFRFDSIDCIQAKKLFELITGACQTVINDWNFPLQLEKFCYWYNINRRHNYNNVHNHPESFLSGVYYIKVPENSGSIEFQRSESERDRLQFQNNYLQSIDKDVNNPRVNLVHRMSPEEGKLIIFPGHLNHLVEQNNTEDERDERISISFNFYKDL